MRKVCFVKRQEFTFTGKIAEHALVLGDIDNDGENELVVGNMDGRLGIFRREHMWQTIGDLGQIVSVAVGDILNCGSNAVVVISLDGWCKIYLCLKSGEAVEKLQRIHLQRLAPNGKVLLLGDIQAERITDLVLGLSDSVVRVYRWLQTPRDCQLVCLYRFNCAQELGNVSITKDIDDTFITIVSQPGATYLKLKFDADGMRSVDTAFVSLPADDLPQEEYSAFSTRILGNVGYESSVAIAHLEGFIFLLNKKSVLLWSHKIPHQPFALCKADLSSDGNEYVIAACWSGHTYLINYRGEIVCFEFNRDVQAFTAGTYNQKGNVLVYATFEEKIYIYYDVKLKEAEIRSLYHIQAQNPKYAGYTREQMAELTRFCMYYYEPAWNKKPIVRESKFNPVFDVPSPSESSAKKAETTSEEAVAGPSGMPPRGQLSPSVSSAASSTDPGPSHSGEPPTGHSRSDDSPD